MDVDSITQWVASLVKGQAKGKGKGKSKARKKEKAKVKIVVKAQIAQIQTGQGHSVPQLWQEGS